MPHYWSANGLSSRSINESSSDNEGENRLECGHKSFFGF
jgi:hypothetical protein